MNPNDAIQQQQQQQQQQHNRNTETAPRLRYSEPINVFPIHCMQPVIYPVNSPVFMTTTNHSHVQPPSPLSLSQTQIQSHSIITANDHHSHHSQHRGGGGGSASSESQSGIMSPSNSSDTGIASQPPYRISSWQDIADGYDGADEKPKCGKLRDNVYFTQRSASSDMYMLFDRKTDYINNFVNYYFSDKNLARDQKLAALMDDKGIVPLSALTKFPKLQQIDTTVEDLIKAFQYNSFVAAVDFTVNGNNSPEKGAQRRDRLCAADVVNRNGFEKPNINMNINSSSISSIDASTHELIISPSTSLSSNHNNPSIINQQSMNELNNMALQTTDATATVCQPPNPSFYLFNPNAFYPHLFSQQANLIPAVPSLNSYQYVMPLSAPYTGHAPQSTPSPGHHIYPASSHVWAVAPGDFNNPALVPHIASFAHHNPVVNANHTAGHNTSAVNNRFLQTTAVNISSGYNSVATVANAESTVGGNRMIN